ncbi:MAG: alpha,alpha-trehalose-phosphate synthase (UDP-forming) [bacterium]
MSRLVVVSNRLPSTTAVASRRAEIPAGGLASAVHQALRSRPESLWFGWTGRVTPGEPRNRLSRQVTEGLEVVGLSLTRAEHDDYYLGFCNSALWPLCHGFTGRARLERGQYETYRSVQARFARALAPLLRADDLVWVHDYHFLSLGAELRRLGFDGRIGFFLHVPFPPHDLWQILPEPREMLAGLLAYDLAGFHVDGFRDNYLYSCRRELGATWDGETLACAGRRQRVGVYPIGIDPDAFQGSAAARSAGRRAARLRFLRDRRLVLGVDRLDYTKGIPERILAFEAFLRRHEEWRRRVVLVQISSPSRVEVPAYVEQKQRVEAIMGRVNGELADHDWMPVRYLYRTYPRDFLAGLYRQADVGLVTPLRDGMNLVAKEYVASQNPESPGVLVLSRTTGAAQEMKEALLVNPFLTEDVADGIERALSMPLAERRERHAALLARVRAGSASEWSRRFLEDLAGSATFEPSRRAPTREGLVPVD